MKSSCATRTTKRCDLRRIGLVCLVVAALHLPGPAAPPSFTLLSANVGNLDVLTGGPCNEWPRRGALCVEADERYVREAVSRRQPDAIALFEVMPGTVSRMVDGDYDVICDQIGGYDCLAVKRAVFQVVGHETPPQPPPCVGKADFAAVFAVDVLWRSRPVRFVVAHPYQAFDDEEDLCRAAQTRQSLVDLPRGDTILVGDMNMDPDRMWLFYASPEVWTEHVGRGKPFRELSDGLVLPTPTWLGALALDRVAVRGLGGGCATVPPLGPRMDHRARWCEIR